jgi:transposase
MQYLAHRAALAARSPIITGIDQHVNRIKLIKRKMYGRTNFDLLRIRVIARAP